jgi:hypothetical protein
MTDTSPLLPLHPVLSVAFLDFPASIYATAMRFLCASLLLVTLQTTATADALLSVTATAGPESCQVQSASGSASCSASANVFVPAGQFDSPATASGAISFGRTTYSQAVSLGPQPVVALDYSLAGNWSMGQGIGLSDQAGVSFNATLTLPSQSGDWTFYSSVFDATDDSGGELGPIQIVTTDGSAWLAGGFPSAVTIHHPAGTPFVVSLQISDFVAQADSSNTLTFDLRLIDPLASPEPLPLATAILGLTLCLGLCKIRFLR